MNPSRNQWLQRAPGSYDPIEEDDEPATAAALPLPESDDGDLEGSLEVDPDDADLDDDAVPFEYSRYEPEITPRHRLIRRVLLGAGLLLAAAVGIAPTAWFLVWSPYAAQDAASDAPGGAPVATAGTGTAAPAGGAGGAASPNLSPGPAAAPPVVPAGSVDSRVAAAASPPPSAAVPPLLAAPERRGNFPAGAFDKLFETGSGVQSAPPAIGGATPARDAPAEASPALSPGVAAGPAAVPAREVDSRSAAVAAPPRSAAVVSLQATRELRGNMPAAAFDEPFAQAARRPRPQVELGGAATIDAVPASALPSPTARIAASRAVPTAPAAVFAIASAAVFPLAAAPPAAPDRVTSMHLARAPAANDPQPAQTLARADAPGTEAWPARIAAAREVRVQAVSEPLQAAVITPASAAPPLAAIAAAPGEASFQLPAALARPREVAASAPPMASMLARSPVAPPATGARVSETAARSGRSWAAIKVPASATIRARMPGTLLVSAVVPSNAPASEPIAAAARRNRLAGPAAVYGSAAAVLPIAAGSVGNPPDAVPPPASRSAPAVPAVRAGSGSTTLQPARSAGLEVVQAGETFAGPRSEAAPPRGVATAERVSAEAAPTLRELGSGTGISMISAAGAPVAFALATFSPEPAPSGQLPTALPAPSDLRTLPLLAALPESAAAAETAPSDPLALDIVTVQPEPAVARLPRPRPSDYAAIPPAEPQVRTGVETRPESPPRRRAVAPERRRQARAPAVPPAAPEAAPRRARAAAPPAPAPEPVRPVEARPALPPSLLPTRPPRSDTN